MNAKEVADAINRNAMNDAEVGEDGSIVATLRPKGSSRVFVVQLSVLSVEEI